ncbi:hypothetical protein LAZ67_22000200 [Cordylochernes scorpioides]|uniref:Uncharacterized protein n=1 Tax=Cordylochernes scorpioides TaxID=51811 RepID=A0ABY6LN68_9ARAC|nr:hypothetical protein LAZ67_22000200 [Cordylochernes scorpioides]
MIAFLMGLQGGFTTFPATFVFKTVETHYVRREWPSRSNCGDKKRQVAAAEVEAGVFVGPQIKQITECKKFSKTLSRVQKAAWNSFVKVIRGFLENHKGDNYVKFVENLVACYGAMGCRMSLKVHMLDAHLDAFKDNMGAYSEEVDCEAANAIRRMRRSTRANVTMITKALFNPAIFLVPTIFAIACALWTLRGVWPLRFDVWINRPF